MFYVIYHLDETNRAIVGGEGGRLRSGVRRDLDVGDRLVTVASLQS